jgi:glycosyltransferase involved in cell wall biosynthesis
MNASPLRRLPMQVVVLNDFAYVSGGAASVAIVSALGLAARGHAVTFFSAVGPVDSRLSRNGIRVECLGQYEIISDPRRLRAVGQGIWNLRAEREMGRVLAGMSRADTVIHVHGWTKALSASVIRVAVDRGFKVVCTLHDYFAACPNGGFFDYRSLRPCHLKPLSLACVARNCDSRSYLHKLWRVGRQVVQQGIGGIPRGIDAFILLSRLSDSVIRSYLPRDARFFQVPNPVCVPHLPPVDVGENSSFVMVGRLSPEKGGVVFARAARLSGVPAIFVGDGTSRCEISDACPAAEISGWVPGDAVGGYLERARALVLPSLWYEGRPLVVSEAAARGVPAIVSDSCSGAESVVDGVTGVLFRAGDVGSLSAALRSLSDDSFVRRMGQLAYERYWSDPLTVERHVQHLERIYGGVLARDVEDIVQVAK